MDWVLIAIAAVFVISIVVGAWRGAIKIVVSLAATLITFIVVFFATPFVAELIETKTPLDDLIRQYAVIGMTSAVTNEEGAGVELTEEGVKRVLNAAGVSEEELEEHGISISDIVDGKVKGEELAQYGISSRLLAGLRNGSAEVIAEEVEDAELSPELQEEAIRMADMPEVFKELLSKNNTAEEYGKLGVETFAQYVAAYMSKTIINVIAFLGTFIFTILIVRAVVFALNIVADLPVLGTVNRMAGAALGLVGALIIVWLAFVAITLLYTTTTGREVYDVIQGNVLTKALYECNPIMKLALKL